MHANSLSIRNFRQFRALDVGGLRPFTLLVGQNNSGKTSVLEAIVALLSRDPIVVPGMLDRERDLPPAPGATTSEVFGSVFQQMDLNNRIELKMAVDGQDRVVQVWFEEPTGATTPDRGLDDHVEFGKYATDRPEPLLHWSVSLGGKQVHSSVAWRDPRPQFAGDQHGGTIRQWHGSDQAPIRIYLSTSPWLGDDFFQTFGAIRKMGGHTALVQVLQDMAPGLEDLQIFTYGGKPRLEAKVGSMFIPVQLLGDGVVRTLT